MEPLWCSVPAALGVPELGALGTAASALGGITASPDQDAGRSFPLQLNETVLIFQ